MDLAEAKSGVKAVYLQAASLSGFEVGPDSPEVLSAIVSSGFDNVDVGRRAEAVANILRLIAATLEHAQQSGVKKLRETDVRSGQTTVCPVYPFGTKEPTNVQTAKSTKSRGRGRGR